MQYVAIIFSFLFGFQANALVNLETGELSVQAVDLELTNGKSSFKMFRFYNHRVNSYGFLGSKWCTNIEQAIKMTSKGINGMACGKPTQMLFKKNEKIKLKNSDVAYNWDGETLIRFGNNKGFIRYTQLKQTMTYDENGRLTSISPTGSKSATLKISYDAKSGQISKLSFNKKSIYTFKYNDNRLLAEIKGPKNKFIRYTYTDGGMLASASNIWGKQTLFTYDNRSRMTEITYYDKRKETIDYDPKLNVVMKTKDIYDCATTYKRVMDLSKASLTMQIKNDCKSTTEIYTSKRSPLFQKNQLNITKLSLVKNYHTAARTPASLPAVTNGKSTQKILFGPFAYKVTKDEIGQPLEITELNFKTNEKFDLKLEYKNLKVISISAKNIGKLNYVYNEQGVLVKQYADDNQPMTVAKIIDPYLRFVEATEQTRKGLRK